MLTPWLVWGLTMLGFIGLSVGAYLIGHHRGYVAGRSDHIGGLPGDPWRPPSEAEFLSELIEAERKKPEPPRKYQREK